MSKCSRCRERVSINYVAVVGMSSLFLAPHLLAQEEGNTSQKTNVYAGVSFGSTHFSGPGPGNVMLFQPRQHFSADETGLGVYVGYALTNWFAAEIHYTDFGEAQHRFRVNPDVIFVAAPNDTQTTSASGYGLTTVWSLPITTNLMWQGKLGVTRVDFSNQFFGGFSEIAGDLQQKKSSSEYGIDYGMGAKYQINFHWAVKADWRHYELDEFTLNRFALGMDYQF